MPPPSSPPFFYEGTEYLIAIPICFAYALFLLGAFSCTNDPQLAGKSWLYTSPCLCFRTWPRLGDKGVLFFVMLGEVWDSSLDVINITSLAMRDSYYHPAIMIGQIGAVIAPALIYALHRGYINVYLDRFEPFAWAVESGCEFVGFLFDKPRAGIIDSIWGECFQDNINNMWDESILHKPM